MKKQNTTKPPELSTPLPHTLPILNVEISLEINTGNIIHEKFDNLEDALKFVNEYAHNPAKILERITPKKKSK